MEILNPSFSTQSFTAQVQARAAKTRAVSIVVYPGVEILDVTGPMEVFAFANIGLQQSGVSEPGYTIELLAEKPGALTTSCGLQIIANRAYGDIADGIDTLLIAGTTHIECLLSDPLLQDWIRAVAPRVRRLASVCTGAFLLAESGLLDGLRATSHWLYCNQFAHDYPSIRVEPNRIFVQDGHNPRHRRKRGQQQRPQERRIRVERQNIRLRRVHLGRKSDQHADDDGEIHRGQLRVNLERRK